MKGGKEYNKLLRKRDEYELLSLLEAIKADIKRYGGIRKSISFIGFWVVLSYRIANFCYKKKIDLLGILVQFVVQIFTNCEISRKAVIGKGLVIYHPVGIVIGPHILIGNKATILPHVFVGHDNVKIEDFTKDVPLISDNVYIGAGSKIIGNCYIGENSIIGPNCVIIKNIKPDSIVLPSTIKCLHKSFFEKS